MCGATEILFRDLVAGFKHHVHFAQRKDIATDPDKVNEEAWLQLQEHGWGERIKRSKKADCLKAEATTASKRAVTKHVKFWKENPDAVRGGEVMKAIGEVFCATVGLPICETVKLIKSIAAFVDRLQTHKGDLGKTLESLWDDFKKDTEKVLNVVSTKFNRLFEGFKSFLTLKGETQFLDEAGRFAGTLFTTVMDVTELITSSTGVPKLLAKILGAIIGAAITGLLTPPVTLLAAINLGARKLFEWLLPEIILGVGALGGDGKGDALLDGLLNELKKIAGMGGDAAGGIIGMLVKDEKKKKKIQAILEKVSNVAGKIEQGLGSVLDLSQKLAKGNFDELEQSLAGADTKRVPENFTADQFKQMIDGLLDFVGEEVWGLINPKLRDLLGKGLSALDKVLGIPRGAMVAGVGSIPFAGGVLGAALGFGFDVVVGIVKDFLVERVVMPLVEFILKDIIEGLKAAFNKRFFVRRKSASTDAAKGLAANNAPPLTELQVRVRAAVKKTQSVNALEGALGASVDGVKETLRLASLQHRGTLSSLVMTAMKDVVLRGTANAKVREMVGAALGSMAPSFGEPGFTLAKGVGAVLRQVEGPLGLFLGGTVPNPRVREVLQGGLAALVRKASSPQEAAKLGRSQEGVLGQLGIDLIAQLQPQLAALLLGKHDTPSLRGFVEREMGELVRVVRRDGFASLLRFGELYHQVVARTTRAVASQFAAGLPDPVERLALLQDMDVLANQVASEVLAGRGAGDGLLPVIAATAQRRAFSAASSAAGGGR